MICLLRVCGIDKRNSSISLDEYSVNGLLITIFILILMILFLDFLYHCNFNILWLKCTIDYFMVHGFIFAIGLSLDFFLSVFTICKCSNELDE